MNPKKQNLQSTLAYWSPEIYKQLSFSKCCCCSVAKSCPILCSPMDCSTPGASVLHPGFTQIHVHWVCDAINHLILWSPFSFCFQSFPASGFFQMSQFFTSGGQSIGSSLVTVLPMNIQGWFPLRLTGLMSLQSKGLSRVFSSTLQKHLKLCIRYVQYSA